MTIIFSTLELAYLLRKESLRLPLAGCLSNRPFPETCESSRHFARRNHRCHADFAAQKLLFSSPPTSPYCWRSCQSLPRWYGHCRPCPMLPTETPAETPVEPAGEMSAVVEIGGVTGPPAWRAVHPDLFAGIKKKSTILPTKYSAFLVENSGIEPLTSCMPCKRSPS